MNHPATFSLPLAAGRVLDVLHATLQIGELGIMSHAEIAREGHLSEGAVSRAMLILVEHGFVERAWDDELNGGRGGYLLTLLPLPDRDVVSHPSVIRSADDPITDESRTTAPAGLDQQVIPDAPAMVHDHDLYQQQEQHARARDSHVENPLYQALIDAKAHPPIAQDIVLACPDRTPAELARALEFGRQRVADGRAARGNALVFGIWRRGERLIEELDDGQASGHYRGSGNGSAASRPAASNDSGRSGYSARTGTGRTAGTSRPNRSRGVAPVAGPEYYAAGGWNSSASHEHPDVVAMLGADGSWGGW